jgi:hypothetical protein
VYTARLDIVGLMDNAGNSNDSINRMINQKNGGGITFFSFWQNGRQQKLGALHTTIFFYSF